MTTHDLSNPQGMLVTDQVALVTGAGSGIGRGIAVALARFGADVVVTDLDLERATRTGELIGATGRRALVIAFDALDASGFAMAVDRAVDTFGRLDILVNNVGGTRGQPFLEQSVRSRQRHVDLNLTSVFAATAAAVPTMIAGGKGGTILNITSIEATRGAPMFAIYAACKAGVNSFTRTMAVELAEYGITVNALMPDFIGTPGNHGIIHGPVPEELPSRPDVIVDGIGRYVPLGHEGSVDEIAGTAVFLASSFGRYITGVALSVDGGTWASSGWTRGATGAWGLFHPWKSDAEDA